VGCRGWSLILVLLLSSSSLSLFSFLSPRLRRRGQEVVEESSPVDVDEWSAEEVAQGDHDDAFAAGQYQAAEFRVGHCLKVTWLECHIRGQRWMS
jgi:hypothetical protein